MCIRDRSTWDYLMSGRDNTSMLQLIDEFLKDHLTYEDFAYRISFYFYEPFFYPTLMNLKTTLWNSGRTDILYQLHLNFPMILTVQEFNYIVFGQQTYFPYTEYPMDTQILTCLLYTSPSPRDLSTSRMPSSA
eukprot:TRINITY_DN51740_c0_g1_i1.p3 TRINITY_DN51740_c0_g1~~TRINITY_DN51740_c0_g1_i1.p3  ORF type:complete len:133 (-),score=17.74 TRINITY_DN51740_c0_g1_i1:93-491(-)